MYDGTYTTTRPDPALVGKGTLSDGRLFYVVRDEDPFVPEPWDSHVGVYSYDDDYDFAERDPRITRAHERRFNGAPYQRYSHATGRYDRRTMASNGELIARYLRIFYNATALHVPLTDYRDFYNVVLVDWTGESTYDMLNSWADEWQQYVSGDVYGVIVTDPATGADDSCWGFYGDPDELVKDAFDGHFFTPEDVESYESV